MQKPLGDMAIYLKDLIPANIPDSYSIKPIFTAIADENSLRNGVLAFKGFLFLLYDRLAVDCSLYDKAPKKDGHVVSLILSHPFLNNLKSVLINIGYYGELTENDTSITLSNRQILTASLAERGEGQYKANITTSKVIEVLRFLTDCGIQFEGVELNAKKPDISKDEPLVITYPDDSAMLTGLKVMATAHKKTDNRENDELFLRCDYRVLKQEETDTVSLLNDSIHPLSPAVQDFVKRLHHRYINAGVICKVNFALGFRFCYYSKQKEIYMISAMPTTGYRIQIKAQNILQYPEIMSGFSLPVQEKIKTGYGCEKKRYGEPCQKGCHGYSFALDDSIDDLSGDIEIWLDKELACIQAKTKK